MAKSVHLKNLLFVSCLMGLSSTTDTLLYPDFQSPPTDDVQMPAISKEHIVEAFNYARDEHKKRLEKEDEYLSSGNVIPRNHVSAEARMFGVVSSKSLEQQRIREQFEDATKYIAKLYKLTEEQITRGLPKISLPGEVPVVQECRNQSVFANCDVNYKYRTGDGRCNNLQNPNWGRAYNAASRMTKANYADGISEPQVSSRNGYSLPNARVIATTISPDVNVPSKTITHLTMAFGQFLAHDTSNTPISRAGSKMDFFKCCPAPNSIQSPPSVCFNVEVPEDDSWHNSDYDKCMPFVRSIGASADCTLGTPRLPIRQATTSIDLSTVYGNSDEEMQYFRTFKGGLLRSQETIHGELPIENPDPEQDQCSQTLKRHKCFWAGDFHVNVQPGILVFEVLFLRQHNRIARLLSTEYPEKTDEEIFQEARRIVGSQLLVMTYNEYLPLVLGPNLMKFFKLNVLEEGYTEYDQTIDPTFPLEMVTGAHRYGHTLVQNTFKMVDRQGLEHEDIQTATNQFGVFPDLFYNGEMDNITRGLFYQASQESDRYYVDALGNHLFQAPNESYGLDVRVLEIQRGRDHGLPSYTDMVEFCFHVKIDSFDHLNITMKKTEIDVLRSVYTNVDDIDFFMGGLLETPVEGGLKGPTLSCVMGKSFHDLKYGDRFYFEHGNQTGSYTKGQLEELRKTTLAGFLCANSDELGAVTPSVKILMDEKYNPLTMCSDIPTSNFSKWFDK